MLFGVSKAIYSMHCDKEVCATIVKVMLPKYIRVPAGDELKVIGGFKDGLGFLQCAGVTDRTHIPIISPEERPADYYKHKGFHHAENYRQSWTFYGSVHRVAGKTI